MGCIEEYICSCETGRLCVTGHVLGNRCKEYEIGYIVWIVAGLARRVMYIVQASDIGIRAKFVDRCAVNE